MQPVHLLLLLLLLALTDRDGPIVAAECDVDPMKLTIHPNHLFDWRLQHLILVDDHQLIMEALQVLQVPLVLAMMILALASMHTR
jgi:hypothetical protein